MTELHITRGRRLDVGEVVLNRPTHSIDVPQALAFAGATFVTVRNARDPGLRGATHIVERMRAAILAALVPRFDFNVGQVGVRAMRISTRPAAARRSSANARPS